MTDDPKRVRKTRGVPIPLGSWWHLEIATAFGERSHAAIAGMVTIAANNPKESWDGNEIGKLRHGKTQPTLPLINAISKAFPVTNPVFIAQSKDEAIDLRAEQLRHVQLRARASQQRPIEGAEVTARVTAVIEEALGPDGIEKLQASTKAAQKRRESRALRTHRDRQKK